MSSDDETPTSPLNQKIYLDQARRFSKHKESLAGDSKSQKEEYKASNKCEIITLPRRAKDTSLTSFLNHSTGYISDEDTTNFIEDLRTVEEKNEKRLKTKEDPLELHIFLNTYGGSLTAAEIICKSILRYPGITSVFVVERAMSAGTLIALCAHHIYLNSYSYLGKIDPQLGGYWTTISANYVSDTFLGKLETPFLRDLMRLVQPAAYGANDRVSTILEDIKNIRGWSDKDLTVVKEKLTTGSFGHDSPYFYDDLKKFWTLTSPTLENHFSEDTLALFKIPPITPQAPKNGLMSMFGL